MTATDVVRRLHQHRMWSNHNLLSAAESLPEASLRRSFTIGQGSVWKTLTHLFAAEFVWLETLSGNQSGLAPGDAPGKLPGNQEGEHPIASLAQLKTEWAALDARWQKYLTELPEAKLEEPVVRVAAVGRLAGQRIATRTLDVLLHVCTHAQYTTAQAINMLRQLGLEKLPDVMLISLARGEAVAGR